MQQDSSVSRRRLLSAVGCTSAAVLGGCLADDEDQSTPSTDEDQQDGDDESAADEPDSEQPQGEESSPEESDQEQVATAGDWPMELQNAQRNPVVTDRSGPTESPERRWSYELPASEEDDGLFQPTARPIVRDGTVYAQTLEGTCVALDARSGELEWSESVPRDSFSASIVTPAVTADALVVASEGVRGLDPGDGTERWHVPLEYTAEWIAVAEDLVIASDLNDVVGIDAATGTERWRIDELRDPMFAVLDEPGEHVITHDVVEETVHCYDASTLEERWTYEPEVLGGGNFFAVADGRVYVPAPFGSTFRAIGVESGAVEETVELSIPGEAAITDDSVFLPTQSEDARLTALDREDWTVRSDWNVTFETEVTGPPVVTRDAVFAWTDVTADPALFAADRSSGEVLWQHDLEQPVDGFAVTEEFLYAFTDGEIVALGPA